MEECVSFTPLSLYPRRNRANFHCIEGGVGPRANVGVTEEKEISFPYRESNSDSLVVQPVA
jgi:hypothetical protein